MLVERQHLCGAFPGTVEEKESGVDVNGGEGRPADTDPNIIGQIDGDGFGKCDEQVVRVLSEGFYGTLAASFARVDDDDGAWRAGAVVEAGWCRNGLRDFLLSICHGWVRLPGGCVRFLR